ncbi:hypothetical protein [Amylolactobacillus amylophilus]|uniref:hypothetical protein n=1 Tax=Amylolactobacillus amylophilus TaxID=1603 RepID=UPI0006D26D92|nr:hypothetical protein [Amylolactobacillus amylophilus]
MFKYDWTKRIVRAVFNLLGRHLNPDKVLAWQNITITKIDNFYEEGMQLKRAGRKLLFFQRF